MPKLFSVVLIILLFTVALITVGAEIPVDRLILEPEVITVTNVNELLQSIGSNRIIQLSPSIYDFSLADFSEPNYPNEGKKQLVISGVQNLTIIGVGEQLAEIRTEDPLTYVMVFKDCRNITLKNLEIGHLVGEEKCKSGVLAFENCSEVYIESSIIYSGVEGLSLSKVSSFKFSNSTIKDCSLGIFTCLDSTGLEFSESYFINNHGLNFINFFNCASVLIENCEISDNNTLPGEVIRLYTRNALFNICNTTGLRLKNTQIHSNTAENLLCSDDKEVIITENSFFENNSFTGGWFFPIKGFSDKGYFIPTVSENLSDFYSELEYLSQKLNDPEKMDNPKSIKIYKAYWEKVITELEELISQQGTDWEKESLLGRFYQLGLQLNDKKAWRNAETHLKNAILMNTNLPNVNHLVLGVLYSSKLFSFKISEKDDNSKLTVVFKSNNSKLITLATDELFLDSRFPGTANIYLFLIYYSRGDFIEAIKQADKYLVVYPEDELVKKLRGMAKARIGNRKAPGELNVYIQREKIRSLFDFNFSQGSSSEKNQEDNLNIEDNNNPHQQRLAEVVLQGIQGLDFNYNSTKEEVIKTLGEPWKIQIRKVANRHQEGLTDTIYDLTYDGLEISVYGAQGKEFIFTQKVSNPKFSFNYGLSVGVTKEYVIEQIGDPVETAEGNFRYTYNNRIGTEIFLWFTFKDNKVTDIKWFFAID